MTEVALRWVSHHSLLKREYGDSILIGASSVNHIEQNMVDLEKGPLRKSFIVLWNWQCLTDLFSGRSS